jgi:hypothetical protein
MKTNKLTFVSLLSALFITVSVFAPSYAAQNNPPPTKAPTPSPTGADCQAQATAAAEKVKKAGGTAAQQQAAYSQAKMKCQGKM